MKAKPRALFAFVASVGAALASPRIAFAEETGTQTPRTQLNAGLRGGLAGQGTSGPWPETLFYVGLHGDALFGRRSPRSFGFGPAISASTTGFRDLTGTLGASLLLPVHDYLPFVLSAGPTVRHHETYGNDASAYASLFWGSRSFNYTGNWGLAGGLVVEGRKTLTGPADHVLIVSAHLDLQILTLPAILLLNALR